MSTPPLLLTSMAPGESRRAPRAHVTSDALRILLDGTWRFSLAARADDLTDGFEVPGFDDEGWGTVSYTHLTLPTIYSV